MGVLATKDKEHKRGECPHALSPRAAVTSGGAASCRAIADGGRKVTRRGSKRQRHSVGGHKRAERKKRSRNHSSSQSWQHPKYPHAQQTSAPLVACGLNLALRAAS